MIRGLGRAIDVVEQEQVSSVQLEREEPLDLQTEERVRIDYCPFVAVGEGSFPGFAEELVAVVVRLDIAVVGVAHKD